MNSEPVSTKSRILFISFLVAMFLGAGPGLFLAAGEAKVVCGVPLFYLWVVFWFVVLGGIVSYTSTTVWSKEDEEL
jgi:hypothetical protein